MNHVNMRCQGPDAQLWCRTTEANRIREEYQQEDAEFKATGDKEEFQRVCSHFLVCCCLINGSQKQQHAIKKNTEWMEVRALHSTG